MKKVSRVVRTTLGALLALGIALFPRISHAVVNINTGTTVTLNVLQDWIENIADFLLAVGSIIAVIFIIWGGIMYMAAGGDSEKAKTAKTRIWNGVIGALIVLGVGMILLTINHLVNQGFTY